MAAPTQADLFLAGRREALISPTRFDRAIIDVEGSDVNVVLNASAAMGEEVALFLQGALNERNLGTAKQEALDRKVYDDYQLPRKRATSSVVTVRLQRSGSIGFTVAAGSVVGTATGETFATTVDVSFPTGSLGPYSVTAVAQRAGTGGNVVAGAISKVITSTADSTLSATNVEAAAGGREEETDDEYRARARDFFSTARRGTKEAIEFGAEEVDQVFQATAEEVINSTTLAPGYRVQLYATDVSGQANSAMSDLIMENLDEYRALGVPVSVVPAVPQYVSVIATGLQFTAGANTASVLSDAANAVVALINGLPPNSTLRRADVLRALSAIPQLIVPHEALTEPAGDLVPTTGSVLRTTKDRVQLSG